VSSGNPPPISFQITAEIVPDSIKSLVGHLRQSCRDTSVASLLHMLRLALGFIFPHRDWSWIKIVAKRIHAGAFPAAMAHEASRAPNSTRSVLRS